MAALPTCGLRQGEYGFTFMTAASSLISELRGSLSEESARIQREFAASGDGRTAVAQRTELIEGILQRLWLDLISPEADKPRNFALVATGGFGRGWLFPYSDIDLLFLFADRGNEQAFKDPVRRFSQELWDLRLKLSPATRTLAECERYDPNNTEFTISLLDCRYLAGDRDLFARLHDKVIPKLVEREAGPLLQGLAEVTRERHGKFGQTVYHLEPNLKETPGGLRDYNVACWLALISAMDKLHDWPDASSLRAPVRRQLDAALEFLMSARFFLHFRHGRDDNALSWEAQDEVAARRIGVTDSSALSAALFWPRPRGAAHRGAVARGNSGGVVFALSSISKLAIAAFDSGFFRCRRAYFSAAAFRDAGSGNFAAPFSLHGPPWPEVEHDHGIPHRTGIAGSGVASAAWGRTLALPAGNFAAATCRRRVASDALAAPAHFAFAGTESHRFAGGARLLSSFHC
jgi:hypothetical protein